MIQYALVADQQMLVADRQMLYRLVSYLSWVCKQKVLQLASKCGLNGCENKWPHVKVFSVLKVTSCIRRRMCKGCGTQNEWMVYLMKVHWEQNENEKCTTSMKSVQKEKCIANRGCCTNKKSACMHKGVIAPTALYGAKTWGMQRAERKKRMFMRWNA